MRMKGFKKGFLAAVACLGLGLLSGTGRAEASTLTYNFDLTNNGFAQAFYDQANINNSRVYIGAGTGTAVYDTVTHTLQLSYSTTGTVFGALSNNGVQEIDRSNTILSGVLASASMSYTNITLESSPSGLFGLQANNSTSNGTLTVADLGLGGGATPVSYGAMAMFMDFSSDPGLVATHPEYTDIAGLGSSNYFQYVSTDPLSSLFNQLVFFSWFTSNSAVVVNGINYGKVHADGLGHSAVPEPASMLLLGCGMLGGMAARRKRV